MDQRPARIRISPSLQADTGWVRMLVSVAPDTEQQEPMRRVADYVETLTPAEREQFADLITECTAREAAIAANASQTEAALARLAEREREFHRGIEELKRLSSTLQDTIGRLYLVSVPPKGSVS
jgi:hypothetical protein